MSLMCLDGRKEGRREGREEGRKPGWLENNEMRERYVVRSER